MENDIYKKKYLKYKRKYLELLSQRGGVCKNQNIPEPYCKIIEEPCPVGSSDRGCKDYKIRQIDKNCGTFENCTPFKCKVDPEYSMLCSVGQAIEMIGDKVENITDKNVVKTVASTAKTAVKKVAEIPKLVLDPNKALERASEILFGYTEFLEDVKKATPYQQKVDDYIKYLRTQKICQKTVDKLQETNNELKSLLDTFKKSAKEILKNQEKYGDAATKNTVIEVSKSTDARLDPNKYKKIIEGLYSKIGILLNEINMDLRLNNDKCYIDPDLKDIPSIGKVPASIGNEVIETHLMFGNLEKSIKDLFGNSD